MTSELIDTNIKLLIEAVTHVKPESKQFHALESNIAELIRKSNTPLYFCRNDINREIDGLCEKFEFHSFFKHSAYLARCYSKYIPKHLTGSELITRLNVVKMCLVLTERPTEKFWNFPERFQYVDAEPNNESVETGIDWGAYLKEDIVLCAYSDSSGSEISVSDEDEAPQANKTSNYALTPTPMTSQRSIVRTGEDEEDYSLEVCRKRLEDCIRHWPEGAPNAPSQSAHFEANVGRLWQQHLDYITGGLVDISPVNITSEYQVMREILWQLFRMHSSEVFVLENDTLAVRSNVTISSLRQGVFFAFLKNTFLPYIDIMQQLRSFQQEVFIKKQPTLICYVNGVNQVINMLWPEIIKLETEIRHQKTTFTLIKLTKCFKKIFTPLQHLKRIHDEVTHGLFNFSPIKISLELITRLILTVNNSYKKVDEEIALTLYLSTIQHYFIMIENLLVDSYCVDYTKEFPIFNNNTINETACVDDRVNITCNPLIKMYYDRDGLIRLIGTQVVELARNIQLLRFLDEFQSYSYDETIYSRFIEQFLAEMSKYGEREPDDEFHDAESEQLEPEAYKEWHMHVDTSDGFLMHVFDHIFAPKPASSDPKVTLYERIRAVSGKKYPLRNIRERILSNILKERFTVSCLSVKNQLIEKYAFERQLQLINEIYLFDTNQLVLFTKRLLTKRSWFSNLRLESHLHDALIDHFPDFYQNVWVTVDATHERSEFDQLSALDAIRVHYDVKWPLNLIIIEKHCDKYQNLFSFLLKIKWALHVLFSLKKNCKLRTDNLTRKFYGLRFVLIGLFNHLKLFVYPNFDAHQRRFKLNMEKSSNLQSIIRAHSTYVRDVYRVLQLMQDDANVMDSFLSALECVKKLNVIWMVTNCSDELNACIKMYESSWNVLKTQFIHIGV